MKRRGWFTPQGKSLVGLLNSEALWLVYSTIKLLVWLLRSKTPLVDLLQSVTPWLVYSRVKLVGLILKLFDCFDP